MSLHLFLSKSQRQDIKRQKLPTWPRLRQNQRQCIGHLLLLMLRRRYRQNLNPRTKHLLQHTLPLHLHSLNHRTRRRNSRTLRLSLPDRNRLFSTNNPSRHQLRDRPTFRLTLRRFTKMTTTTTRMLRFIKPRSPSLRHARDPG